MQKLMLMIAVMMCSLGSFAQTKTDTTGMPREMGKQKMHPNGVMMQDGKMMSIKDGNMTLMTEEATMPNGVKVMTDGTYTDANGNSMALKEGQHMYMSGKVKYMKTKKPKKTDRQK